MAKKQPAKKIAKKKTGTAVAIHKATPPAAPQNFYAMLHALAIDPRVNVTNMQAILDMKAKEDERAARAEFDARMALVQEEMQPVRADMASEKPANKYASATKLDAAIRPIYTKRGFAVSFDTDEIDTPDTVRVVAYVSCAGHNRKYKIDIPADGKGARGGDVMTRTHAVGSAMTYGRGILLRSIFNLIVDKNSDDDGRAASGRTAPPQESGTITPAQVKRIQDLMTDTHTPATRVLDYASKLAGFAIHTPQDIPREIGPDIVKGLEAAKAKMK